MYIRILIYSHTIIRSNVEYFTTYTHIHPQFNTHKGYKELT